MTYSLCIEITASIDTQTWFHSDSYDRNAWLLLSRLLYIWKRQFPDTNFEIGKPCRRFN